MARDMSLSSLEAALQEAQGEAAALQVQLEEQSALHLLCRSHLLAAQEQVSSFLYTQSFSLLDYGIRR
jgi:hypothetical protein